MNNDTSDVLRDSSMEMSNTNRSNSSSKEGEKLYFTSSLNQNIQTSEVIRDKLKKIKSELRRTKKMVDKRDFKNACEKIKYITRLIGNFEADHLLHESHSMHTELISEMVIDSYRILAMSILIDPSNIFKFTSSMSDAWDSTCDTINKYELLKSEINNKKEINKVRPLIDMCKYFIGISLHELRATIRQLERYLSNSIISSKYTICYSEFRDYWEDNKNASFFLSIPYRIDENDSIPVIVEVKIFNIYIDEIRHFMNVRLKTINAFDEDGKRLNIDKVRLRHIDSSSEKICDYKLNGDKDLLMMFKHIDEFYSFEMPFISSLPNAIKHLKYLNMYFYKQNERNDLFNILSNYLIFNDINETIPPKTFVSMLRKSNLSIDNLMSNIDNEYIDCINRALSAFMPYGGVKNIKLALNYIEDVIKENNRVINENTEKKVESFEDDAVETEKYTLLNPLDKTDEFSYKYLKYYINNGSAIGKINIKSLEIDSDDSRLRKIDYRLDEIYDMNGLIIDRISDKSKRRYNVIDGKDVDELRSNNSQSFRKVLLFDTIDDAVRFCSRHGYK